MQQQQAAAAALLTCSAPPAQPPCAASECRPSSIRCTALCASWNASHWPSAQASWCSGAIWCAASCSVADSVACRESSRSSGVWLPPLALLAAPPASSAPAGADGAESALPTSAALSSSTHVAAKSSRQRTVLSLAAMSVSCSADCDALQGGGRAADRRRRQPAVRRAGAAAGALQHVGRHRNCDHLACSSPIHRKRPPAPPQSPAAMPSGVGAGAAERAAAGRHSSAMR